MRDPEARHLRGRPAALLQPARDVIIVLHGDDVCGSSSLARDGKAEGAHAAANHVDSGAAWKRSAAREVLAAALGSVGDRGRSTPCRIGVVRCRRGGAELLCPLTASREGVEEALRQHEEPVASGAGAGYSGSGSELSAALEACGEHFASQSAAEAQRHVWVLTSADWGAAAGGEDAAAAAAERLRREVRLAASFVALRAEAAGQSGATVTAVALRAGAGSFGAGAAGATPERLAAVSARLLLGGRGRLRLGEDLQLELTVRNEGRAPIPAGARLVFPGGAYFGRHTAALPAGVASLAEATVRAALPAQAKGSAGALHAALDALPEHIEFSLRDERDAPIPTLEDAFVLEFQDFAGDIFDAAPAAAAAGGAHILLCGPHGSGKSSFFNSLVSCLSERVAAPAVAGGHTEHVTNEFFRFRLDRHEGLADLPVGIFDSWGIDGANYRGEEMALMLHGALPLQWPMEECVTAEGLRAALEARGQRLQADPSRKIHAVVFIVSYSELDLRSETLDRFAALFRAATLALKRKAVVAISQVDRLGGDVEVLAEYRQKLCALLAISEANVFTLENYCDTKDKSFGIDRAVYRIALAAVRAANDFLCMEANGPVPCPFPLAPPAATPRPSAPRRPVPATPATPPAPARAAAPVPAVAPSPALATFATPGPPAAKPAPPSKSAAQGNGKPPDVPLKLGDFCVFAISPMYSGCRDSKCPKLHDKRLLKGLACTKFWETGKCGRSGKECWFNHKTNVPEELARLRQRLEAECLAAPPAAPAVAAAAAAPAASFAQKPTAARSPAAAAKTVTSAAPGLLPAPATAGVGGAGDVNEIFAAVLREAGAALSTTELGILFRKKTGKSPSELGVAQLSSHFRRHADLFEVTGRENDIRVSLRSGGAVSPSVSAPPQQFVAPPAKSKAASPSVHLHSFWSEEQIASTLVKVLESAGGSLNGGSLGPAFAVAAGKKFKEVSAQPSMAQFCQRRPDLFRVAGTGAPGPQTFCLVNAARAPAHAPSALSSSVAQLVPGLQLPTAPAHAQASKPPSASSSPWPASTLAATLASILQESAGSLDVSSLGKEFSKKAGKPFKELSSDRQPSILSFCLAHPERFAVASVGAAGGACVVSLVGSAAPRGAAAAAPSRTAVPALQLAAAEPPRTRTAPAAYVPPAALSSVLSPRLAGPVELEPPRAAAPVPAPARAAAERARTAPTAESAATGGAGSARSPEGQIEACRGPGPGPGPTEAEPAGSRLGSSAPAPPPPLVPPPAAAPAPLPAPFAARPSGPPPPEFLCPITHEVMVDPVMIADGTGHSYERGAVDNWLAWHGKSPLTGEQVRAEESLSLMQAPFNLQSKDAFHLKSPKL
eukprot:tig00020629_g12367.t1